ncbi:hypothetical protein EK21DRAFT_77906 [Setomelanomma holmii]|uniref:C3H1-type domain-containing protein n=1 Tax=Setomelanomma holmii TaxID=210430 RepID=A0A9P4H0D1_9PLEO|nr:hypothetical protein EK21DRAFT_77906 [Setomelanomma holmii]
MAQPPPFSNGFGTLRGGNSFSPEPPVANGTPTSSASGLAELYSRYQQITQLDTQRDQFTMELLTRVAFLTQENDQLRAEMQHQRDSATAWEQQQPHYERRVAQMQRAMADNPFVVILIDGDGMIFTDEYLRRGEAGGRHAASQLYSAVSEYVDERTTDVPLNVRIVCRIYANARGLTEVLLRKGIIDDKSVFEDFTRGFTRGKSMFDFVDVGSGKDRADEKIIESLKLFSQDLHCRRVLFGCSHDNGYARVLEEFSDRPEIVGKVVLLEGVPFERELIPLPYETTKFPGLFRDTKIILNPSAVPYIYNQSVEEPLNGAKVFNIMAGLPTRFPPPDRAISVMDSPLPSQAALATSSRLPRTPSASTFGSDNFPALNQPITWANKAAAPPPPAPETPVYKPVTRDEIIARNRKGQRVDPPAKSYDKAEVDRIKRMKLCNVHFLRQECPYGTNCTHIHNYKASDDEIKTLRLVARMAPCNNGSGCQDIKCIHGHECPAPPHKYNHIKGTKSCIFGEQCKFVPELHDIDRDVVKTLVIR